MKLPQLEFGSAFRSRIARRIFVLFVGCALLPVGGFALFAYHRVLNQLEVQAQEQLRRESKAAGMSILERLLLMDNTLRAVLDEGRGEAEALEALSRRVRSRTGGGILAVTAPPPSLRSELTEARRRSLEQGGTAIVTQGAPPHARVFLLRGVAGGDWIAAELDPSFLFPPEARPDWERYWVEDETGRAIFGGEDSGWERPPIDPRAASERSVLVWRRGQGELIGGAWPLFLESRFAAPSWVIVHARERTEVLRPLAEFRASFPLIAGLSILLVAWLSILQIRRSLVPIEALSDASRRLADREYDVRVDIRTRDEFHDLGHAFNEMAASIQSHTRVMTTMNEIGAALSAERDRARLLELILQGAMLVTRAGAGALFLVDADDHLVLERFERAGGAAAPAAAPPRIGIAARRCLRSARPAWTDDARSDPEEERGEWDALRRDCGLEVGSWLAVPLRGEEEILGVLLLLRSPAAGEPVPFDEPARAVAESMASQAAVSITKNRLIDSFRALFEGLVELTVKAIDEKSPYTGEHCRKVPILTEMITEAACATQKGAFKDFDLSPAERYELEIAALLHDCGKVVTPVHVMDKATKLETIWDRIALVEMRFEVLRRDLEIRMLRQHLDELAGGLPAPGSEHLARALHELEEELSFLRECNTGGEFMHGEKRERVRRIGLSRRWRTLDGEERNLLDDDEIENLCVSRGTLNAAERETINYHVVATINMLEELPFPKNMSAVPAIAGSHHERVDGKGYPNQLTGREISVQGRILGLADVFEALTAKDRPYKPGRTLTESLRMLEAMSREGHIDAELFELFVREKVYLRYAAEHLSPEQIDGPHREEIERLTLPLG